MTTNVTWEQFRKWYTDKVWQDAVLENPGVECQHMLQMLLRVKESLLDRAEDNFTKSQIDTFLEIGSRIGLFDDIDYTGL